MLAREASDRRDEEAARKAARLDGNAAGDTALHWTVGQPVGGRRTATTTTDTTMTDWNTRMTSTKVRYFFDRRFDSILTFFPSHSSRSCRRQHAAFFRYGIPLPFFCSAGKLHITFSTESLMRIYRSSRRLHFPNHAQFDLDPRSSGLPVIIVLPMTAAESIITIAFLLVFFTSFVANIYAYSNHSFLGPLI